MGEVRSRHQRDVEVLLDRFEIVLQGGRSAVAFQQAAEASERAVNSGVL